MPSDIFGAVEEKCGIIFASCPALRQFFAYCNRVGTAKPTKKRQYPNADFTSMRRRIALRDIFWYRKPSLTGSRVADATPTSQMQNQSHNDSNLGDANSSKSPLDLWGGKLRGVFRNTFGSSNGDSRHGPEDSRTPGISSSLGQKMSMGNFTSSFRSMKSKVDGLLSFDEAQSARLKHTAEQGNGWPGTTMSRERRVAACKYRTWGLQQDQELKMDENLRPAQDPSGDHQESHGEEEGIPMRSDQDFEFAEVLAAGASRMQ